VVPFFNARVQGLYKLGRAAKEDPARFGMVLGTAALVSSGAAGRLRWRRRLEEARGVGPQQLLVVQVRRRRLPHPQAVRDRRHGHPGRARRRVAVGRRNDRAAVPQVGLKIASDNLSMNPIPQLIKPMVDVYANWDSFTDRPIETMGMERLKPDYRFADRTSMRRAARRRR
jgi:hypothetical protein